VSVYFEIAYAAAAKRLCFFTGTGFSKALTENSTPGWRELLEIVCDSQIGNDDFKLALFPKKGPDPLHLDEAAQVISIELSKIGKSIHEEIAKIIRALKPSGKFDETSAFLQSKSYRIVTTNYDKLAEKVGGKDCQTISPGRPIPRSNSRVKAFHVHGSVDVPGGMVVTADDYFNFMNADSYFSRKLSTVLHENTVVILGYSLGDTNLKAILSDYRGFVRSHMVGNSIFFVSRNSVDQRISDYYSNCYGIRVIQNTEVEEFFSQLNAIYPEAEKCVESSLENIHKVLNDKHHFTEKYLRVESSFYEIVSAIGAIGASMDEESAVVAFSDIIAKKMNLSRETGAWPQYAQLAAWLTYLGSLIDVRGRSIEGVFLDAVTFSMERMSKKMTLGYSWEAYKTWSFRWKSISADNRALIADHIKKKSTDPDALEIVSRG
jgi:hypothetical protein